MKTKLTSFAIVGARLLLLAATCANPGQGTSRAVTIIVTSTADSGAGTLRAALASAANGDTIDISGLTGTILLTSGELLVTNSVNILGPGPANLAVDGNAASRVFHISNSVVTIAGLSITNGWASGGGYPTNSGGAIYSRLGTLTINNCSFRGNLAGYGAGIYNDGYQGSAKLTVSASTLSGNSATTSAGGIYNDSESGTGTVEIATSTLSSNSAWFGAGIYNGGYKGNATLTVNVSTLSGNSATNSGGGIYNNAESAGTGMVQITASTLSGNSASSGSGGGIYNDATSSGTGTVQVVNSILSGNSAQYGSGIYNDSFSGIGTLTVSSSTLSNNSAIYSGGGIYNNGESSGNAMLTVTASTLSGNSASSGSGGGVYNDGTSSGNATLTVSASTFSDNLAIYEGGGIYNDSRSGNATVTVSASTLSGNGASYDAGGIYNKGAGGNAKLTVTASTLSGNWAGYAVGGIYNDGSSGSATLTLSASTLSGNGANYVIGGIYNYGSGGNASVEIGSTILRSGGNIANVGGTVSSDGYNLCSDTGGGFLTGTADRINTDPMLGPLQDNGGPTLTHALLPGSPAIDQGKNFNGSATDQRGLPRTVDIPSIPNTVGSDGTDIGAVEFQAPLLSNPGVVAGQYGFKLAGEPNQPIVVEASTNLVNWTALSTNTPSTTPLHFVDPAWTNFPHRFYRSKLAP